MVISAILRSFERQTLTHIARRIWRGRIEDLWVEQERTKKRDGRERKAKAWKSVRAIAWGRAQHYCPKKKFKEEEEKKKEEEEERRRRNGEEGSRRTDRCQGNEGNLHFVKLSLESSRARLETRWVKGWGRESGARGNRIGEGLSRVEKGRRN